MLRIAFRRGGSGHPRNHRTNVPIPGDEAGCRGRVLTNVRRVRRPHLLVLALILVAGFALRVWNIDYGLPFVYSIDEGSHFTSRAVEMFWQDLDPGYYQNPATYTYLIYAVLRVMYGPLGFVFDLPFRNVTDQFDKNPTEIWIAARTLAAALCVGGVAATYWAARRLWGIREGLVAAALLCFAFLPVAYSRVAVTDVGALIGVSLSLGLAVLAYSGRRPLVFLGLAGAAAGLAVSFKYTAGLALLPVAIAALARVRVDGPRAIGGLVVAAVAAVVVFVVLNPYLLTSFDSWWSDLRDQAEVARDQPKPGQESGGVSYYLDSLTWGLGWAAAVAALAGAVLELRRNLVRGLMLIAVPVALFVYLSAQSRYFGRWLLPAYPALAMLAAAAIGQVADLAGGRWRGGAAAWSGGAATGRGGAAVAAAATALLLIQPLAADIRSAQVLGRDDTRQQARDWLEAHYPPELRASVEPAVPGRWFRSNPEGTPPSWLGRCGQRPGWTEPGWSYTAAGGERVCSQYKPGLVARPDGGIRASAYQAVLDPGVIDDYRLYGYCLVVTVDTVRDRALQTGDRSARAYYRRLDRESKVVRTFSPYDKGAGPVPFDFDLSFNYYPTEYHRPGPVVRIRRLTNCRQATGPPIVRIPRAREPAPFAG
jgi:4-amino-4-deoxy-L-arabinose transferase-like glycosyltransferase